MEHSLHELFKNKKTAAINSVVPSPASLFFIFLEVRTKENAACRVTPKLESANSSILKTFPVVETHLRFESHFVVIKCNFTEY